MELNELMNAADKYIEENWGTVVDDIASLVEIESVEDLDAAEPGKPFGPGPAAAALDQALKIAANMGFETTNVDGYMGFADLKGESDTQIGIIGHMDVVPAGPGWNFQPFDVTLKDGFLIGRGVLDDKGPSVVTLHAMKLLKDLGVKLPYTIRFLFGTNEETGMNDVPYYRERYADPAFLFTPDAEFPVCYGEKGGFDATVVSATNEETGMNDVPYYRERYADPAFLFTPDAEFPVCYGEKGGFDATVVSAPIEDGWFAEFEGGSATNAVAGQAFCIVNRIVDDLPEAAGITITYEHDKTRIDAVGKSAHASTPEQGKSAIGILVDYVLANGIGNQQEREFLDFVRKVVDFPDGSGVGIATSDEYFGPLTLNGGTIKLENGRFTQTLDSRWPTSTTPEQITAAITALTEPMGASFENTLLMVPFLVKPDTAPIQALLSAYSTTPEQITAAITALTEPMGASFENTLLMVPFLVKPDTAPIQALLSAYNQVTGEDRKPFTIGGGTYAREFTAGASFGPEMPWIEYPEWAGSMHGPDEAIADAQLKEAFKIYAAALHNLEHIQL